MASRVILTPTAKEDVAEAYHWDESQDQGLGQEFLRCVEACVRGIERNPEMFRIAVGPFRRALIRRFPFEIFYEWSSETLTIFSVFHCSRDPKVWKDRFQGRE